MTVNKEEEVQNGTMDGKKAKKPQQTNFCSSGKCQAVVLFFTIGSVAAVVCIALLSHAVRARVTPEWWKTTIVYQIYPRSFMDTNGDGVGDIKGIISKLDYFTYLNVGAIWISPVYKSPMKDFGYDISDYTDIATTFGSLEDMKSLIKKAQSKELKVILDFVPNHSSGMHQWFNKSVQRIDPFTDYYIWQNGTTKNGQHIPPNNWLSAFTGSAWTWHPDRKQFYYHAYLAQQPDLNYRNPKVVDEMKNVLRFWLDLGVDGFRIDAVSHMFEETNVSLNEPRSNNTNVQPKLFYIGSIVEGNNTTSFVFSTRITASLLTSVTIIKNEFGYLEHIYTENRIEEIRAILDGWRSVLDEYEKKDGNSRFMVVEAHMKSREDRDAWYKTAADMPFYFGLTRGLTPDCGGVCIDHIVREGTEGLPEGAWPNFVMGNHDNRRVTTRKGKEYVDALNMLLLTLRGTPTTYYGEEIGMEDVNVTFSQAVDPAGTNHGQEHYLEFSRDPERSPMQWDQKDQAGFSNNSNTWLPVGPNYKSVNVETEMNATGYSTLHLYKHLASLRQEPTFVYGKMATLVVNNNTYSFVRFSDDFPPFIVALNFGKVKVTENLVVKPVKETMGTVVARTNSVVYKLDSSVDLTEITLDPGQGVVIKGNDKQ